MPRRNENGRGRTGATRSEGRSKKDSPVGRFKKSHDEKRTDRSFGKERNFSTGSPRGDEDKSPRKIFNKSKPGASRFRTSSSGRSEDSRRTGKTRFGSKGDDSKFAAGNKRRPSRDKKAEGPVSRPSRFGSFTSRQTEDPRGRGKTGFASKRDDSKFAAGNKRRPPRGKKAEEPVSRPSRFGSYTSRQTEDPRGRGKTGFASKGDDSKFAAGNKRRPPTGARSDRPKGRGDSFGKPYKKAYRTKSIRERSLDTRAEGSHQKSRSAETSPDSPKSDKIRLNKFIANSGVSSRREADELITMGLISVNGKIVTELGYKVNPGDEIRYEDKVLRAEKPVYILMNKPKGFLTTTDDPQERKTVMHLVASAVKERIYPVGRLDRNTTGLLLLTNDGDLADKLMHPSFDARKVYKVELDKPLTKGDFQTIIEGVRLEEGRAVVDDLAIVSDDKRTIGIELHIGWNRVVRRIFESLGYEVIKLDRTVYAGLDKKDLGRGEWRFLTKEEIIHLKHFK